MSGFSLDWLTLREPADNASRNREVLGALGEWARNRGPLRIVDLGAGTGSARRALGSCVGPGCNWTLVEHDPELIAAGQALLDPKGAIHYRRLDLSADLGQVFAEPVDLITASALIDLVSSSWLKALADHFHRRRCAAWIGLTYDGHLHFTPEFENDRCVIDAFNRDMMKDKGFGPALGPDAHGYLADRLRGKGMVLEGPSPWLLGPGQQALKVAMVDGIAAAAAGASEVESWRIRRSGDTSHMEVGHRDLLFLP
jgi:SAM-dependent methyltransferase